MSRLRLSHFVTALATSALLLGIAGTAHAKLIGFNGTLSVMLGRLPPIIATGVGQAILNSSAGIGGHLTTLQILANTVSVTGATVPITDPGVAPRTRLTAFDAIASLRGTAALGTGILRPISGAAASGTGLTQNVMPVAGTLRLCVVFTGCPSSVPVPLTVGGTRGVGIGGFITINTFGKVGIRFSILAQPWTVKTASVTGIPIGIITTPSPTFGTTFTQTGTTSPFVQGFAHGPASATSSTAAVGGVIQLVTASRIVTTLSQTTITPLLVTLRIHLVPEPGTFLLFGTGVVGLGFVGRSRHPKK